MNSWTEKQIITINILPNFLGKKDNQAMKLNRIELVNRI